MLWLIKSIQQFNKTREATTENLFKKSLRSNKIVIVFDLIENILDYDAIKLYQLVINIWSVHFNRMKYRCLNDLIG